MKCNTKPREYIFPHFPLLVLVLFFLASDAPVQPDGIEEKVLEVNK